MPLTRDWERRKNAVAYPATTKIEGSTLVKPSENLSEVVANTSAAIAPTRKIHCMMELLAKQLERSLRFLGKVDRTLHILCPRGERTQRGQQGHLRHIS